MDRLTPRQAETLAAIRTFRQTHAYAPSIRELGELLHLSSTCTVQRRVEQLVRKGYVARRVRKARCLVICAGEEQE